jgi:elongation factor G
VEAQSETVWRQADKYKVPRIVFINKCDRLGADPWSCVDQLKVRVGATPIVTQLPIGLESKFSGVIDLISMRALQWIGDTTGAVFLDNEIPADLLSEAKAARLRMVEALCDLDEEVLALFVENLEVSPAVLRRALRRMTISGAAVPVLLGAAFRNKGVQPLLDAVVDYLPSPLDLPPVVGRNPEGAQVTRRPSDDEPFAALAFKTMFDVVSEPITFFRVYSGKITSGSTLLNTSKGKKEKISRLLRMHANRREEIRVAESGSIAAAVGLKSTTTGDTLCALDAPICLEIIDFPQPTCSIAIEASSDQARQSLIKALDQLASEDPSFFVKVDGETGQTLISGMGELHLEVIVDRLTRQFGIQSRVGKPEVAYREMVLRAGEGEYVCQQSLGPRALYASVKIRVEPGPDRAGFIFENKCSARDMPASYLEAVRSGARFALEKGAVAGYPIADARVSLLAAQHHALDSSEMAFQIATQHAMHEALQNCGPILLEPIMSLDVSVPSEYVGAVTGNLGSRRGRVVRLETRGLSQAITAEVPLVSMFGYSTDVRSLTQGRATFTMQFLRFSPVPVAMVETIANRNRSIR